MEIDVREVFPSVTCGMCKHFRADADRNPSECKRLDHKEVKFAKPFFVSYNCGQFCGCICRDFTPAEWCVRLREIWTSFDDYNKDCEAPPFVWLVLNGNFSERYAVRYEDFVNNTFRNEDGSLKWVRKMYHRQSRKSPTGYRLVMEDPEGGDYCGEDEDIENKGRLD